MSKLNVLKHRYPDGPFDIEIRDWEIADEGITVLWGPSGAGKSSLLRLLLGLDRADELDWIFHGEQVGSLTIQQRQFGVVFQDASLFWGLTVRQNLEFAREAAHSGRGLDPKLSAKLFADCVEALELGPLLGRKSEQLSGGERSRVAIARAVVGRPRLLMLDEPFSSLDAERKLASRMLTRRLIEELRIPTLLVTHDEADFKRGTDQVVRIEGGRKLA